MPPVVEDPCRSGTDHSKQLTDLERGTGVEILEDHQPVVISLHELNGDREVVRERRLADTRVVDHVTVRDVANRKLECVDVRRQNLRASHPTDGLRVGHRDVDRDVGQVFCSSATDMRTALGGDCGSDLRVREEVGCRSPAQEVASPGATDPAEAGVLQLLLDSWLEEQVQRNVAQTVNIGGCRDVEVDACKLAHIPSSGGRMSCYRCR